MLSTVDLTDELSSEFQTDRYSTDAMTTSSESTSMTTISLIPYKAVVVFFGFLGILTNGLVLVGFWLSDRSKITSSSVHIVNHTTLELFAFSASYLHSYNCHVLDLHLGHLQR